MTLETKLDTLMRSLGQYAAEGVVLETAIANLYRQQETLDRILSQVDSSGRPDAARIFVDLREHFDETRATLDIASDFVEKAATELGREAPHEDRSPEKMRLLAEEGS